METDEIGWSRVRSVGNLSVGGHWWAIYPWAVMGGQIPHSRSEAATIDP